MRHEGRFCRTCSYDLRHLTEHRCPECGNAFDPEDPRTFRARPRQRVWWLLGRLALLGIIVATMTGGPSLIWRWAKISAYEKEQAAVAAMTAQGAIFSKPVCDAPPWAARWLGSPAYLNRYTEVFLGSNWSSGTVYNGNDTARLHALPRLTTLRVGSKVTLTATALQQLRGLDALESIDLSSATLKCDPLTAMRCRGMRRLQAVHVSGQMVTDAVVDELAQLPALRRLEIPGARLTATGVARLGSLPTLEVLNLSDCHGLDDDSAAAISRLPRLWRLDARGTLIRDTGVARLTALAALRELDLRETPITDGCVDDLMRMSCLLRLQVDRRYVPPDHEFAYGISPSQADRLAKRTPAVRVRLAVAKLQPKAAKALRPTPRIRAVIRFLPPEEGGWTGAPASGIRTQLSVGHASTACRVIGASEFQLFELGQWYEVSLEPMFWDDHPDLANLHGGIVMVEDSRIIAVGMVVRNPE